MAQRQAVPVWARLLGEFFVIVTGVLVALAADSWMERRADRQAEVEHLSALSDEFDESVAALRVAKEFKQQQISDLGRLLSAPVAQLPADSLRGWIYDGVYVTRGYVPILSALRDLDASGERALIDPVIRRALALLGVRLESVDRSYEEYLFYHQTVMDPFIAAELPAVALLVDRDDVKLGTETQPDWSDLDSARARGLLAFKLSLAGNYIGALEDLEQQFELLIDLIDRRLAAVAA